MRKTLLIGLLTLTSFSSFSAILNLSKGTTISEAVKRGTCSIEIKKQPIIFQKGERFTRVITQEKGELYFTLQSNNVESVRRIAVGRKIEIKNVVIAGENLSAINFRDENISQLSGRFDLPNLTLGELSAITDQNLKMTCIDDVPVDV